MQQPIDTQSAEIQIILNGQPQSIAATNTVALVLNNMDVAGKRIAVELNGEIVPKSKHATTALRHGDKLEVVIAVGGG